MIEEKPDTTPTESVAETATETKESQWWPRPPIKPLTGWTLLLPLALLAGVWWTQQNPEANLVQNSMSPLPTATAPPAPKSTPSSEKVPTGKNLKFTFYELDDNAMLRRKTVPATLPAPTPETLSNSQTRTHYKEQAATIALQMLMKNRPQDFPRGAELLWFKIQDGIPTANFSSEFLDEKFWQGSARVLGTTQMIVQTLVDNKNLLSGPEQNAVRFMVEDKPVEVLGELDMSEPVAPDPSLVSGN